MLPENGFSLEYRSLDHAGILRNLFTEGYRVADDPPGPLESANRCLLINDQAQCSQSGSPLHRLFGNPMEKGTLANR